MSNQDNNINTIDINTILNTEIRNSFMNLDYNYAIPNTSYNNFNTNNMFGDFNVEDILNFSTFYNIIDSYYEQLDEEILNESLIESLDLQPSTTRQDNCLEFKGEDYNKIDSNKFENTCSVCLVEYDENSIVSSTKCNHLFHHDCIKEWSYYKDTCPVCREQLKE